MGTQKTVSTTLEEDFASIGIKTVSGAQQTAVAEGKPLIESLEPDKTDEGGSGDEADPLDGEFVTRELFDRINALSLEDCSEEDINKLLDELKEKKIPEGDEELAKLAEETARKIVEVAARTTRRFKAGKMAKKRSFQCPQGTRAVKTGGARPRCVRAAAAAGGAGKLAKMGRKKKRWAKSGAGKKAARKSKRLARRRGESVSTFALELGSLLESSNQESMGLRDEIVDRMSRIFELLHEEFLDESVAQVFDEAFNPLLESWEAGRLDEDVLEVDDFVAELKPALTLITKSLEQIDRQGESGND